MGVTARLARTSPWVLDAALGLVAALVGILTTGDDSGTRVLYEERDALAIALILAATLPYVLRTRAPLPVFAFTSLATAALMLGRYDAGALPLVLFVGAYTVGAQRPVSEVLTGTVMIEAILVVLLVADVPGYEVGDYLSSAVAYVAAVAVGWTLQGRGRRIERFEVEQAEAARRAAADERLRIAQELHDVVAHSLGVIAVQAAVGLQVLDRDRETTRQALQHVSQVSRSSLTEIRQLLGRVREFDGTTYAPAPGLGQLATLADELGAAGLRVELHVVGERDGVPPGVGLAAYRITQEALTNTLRHAHADRAEVCVRLEPGVVDIEVTDDGRGGSATPGGHGLVGMRERAAVYGGTVDAGPGARGGFRVHASLPYGEVLA